MSRRAGVSGHTFFFREPEAFVALKQEVLLPASQTGQRINLWSVGCSTGEEAYSLAVVCAELRVSAEIIATDIDARALALARQGEYSRRNARHASPERQAAWFETVGERLRVRPDLRQALTFVEHDVTSNAWPTARPGAWDNTLDAIFCRNVFLYLEPDEVAQAVGTLGRALRPGGLLFLGAGEWLTAKMQSQGAWWADFELVEILGAWVYRKRGIGSAGADDSPHQAPSALSSPPVPATGVGARPRLNLPTTRTSSGPPEVALPRASTVAELRRAGDALLDAGDPMGARRLFEQAVLRDKLVADLHLRLGLCYVRAAQSQYAVEALRRALFLAPELWPASFLLGDLVEVKEPQAALGYFRQTLAVLERPDAPEVELSGALEPFLAGRSAARDAARLRVQLLAGRVRSR